MRLALVGSLLWLVAVADLSLVNGKTLIDYFLPVPIRGPLSTDVWGGQEVGARDIRNGLEDPTCRQWSYWDGQIIKGPDGRYHMFTSRWDQALGHRGWSRSVAVHAVSDNPIGPYEDKGLCWPENQAGKGHNVTALVLPDGRYAIVVSETRPGDVFVSNSLDGPWEHLGSIKVAENQYSHLGQMSNVAIMVRPDGRFQIIARSGALWISEDGILGPYVVQGPSIYQGIPELPKRDLEDPVIWYSGGLYHVVVNCWTARKAYHLTSTNGIDNWRFRGLAYDPTTDFIRYTDGTVNHWFKIERPAVLIEDGHVTYFTFAVIDVEKAQDRGGDMHNSKVIVVPFDGVAFDRDMQAVAATRAQGKPAPRPLYKDPVYDAPTDPVLCFNAESNRWFMYYTARRGNVEDAPGVSWVHGTNIGIAESADGGATWTYKGVAQINYGKGEHPNDYTYWAPEVIWVDGLYHMFLSFVPG
ncbi:MAG: hypothetical protein QHH07_12120, partial [Sedimentisphaerales bacterium]|nr:hypothetical protein [Sedimentisphaerales bacterium]